MEIKHRKRVRHFDEPGHAHFLTFSCFHRLPLLSKDRTRLWMVDAINRARKKHGFHVWAWVLMPEHVHLLIWPQQPASTAEILRSIKIPVAKRAIAYLKVQAPQYLEKLIVRVAGVSEYRFWQTGSGYDVNVIEPTQVYAVVEYIHNNPVLRGLVDTATAWKWSSAIDWLGQRQSLIMLNKESLPAMNAMG
ncbi:MAG: transposase [Gemmatales bacterium]